MIKLEGKYRFENWDIEFTNPEITVISDGSILYSQVITQDSVFAPDNFLQDFLTVLGVTIADVSDEIVICGTPITTTVLSFGAINYKEY